MWYRFEDDCPVGILDVDHCHVAWYDMENDGACFDEYFCDIEDIFSIIPYVETEEAKDNGDRTRVFICFGNGDEYELKLEKVTGRRRGYFYDK